MHRRPALDGVSHVLVHGHDDREHDQHDDAVTVRQPVSEVVVLPLLRRRKRREDAHDGVHCHGDGRGGRAGRGGRGYNRWAGLGWVGGTGLSGRARRDQVCGTGWVGRDWDGRGRLGWADSSESETVA